VLLPHKDELCTHLQNRFGELFNATFDFLFYDITSTYFEGTAQGNPQAKRGYSRDSRPDCPQVCIGLVATKEGLPIAFEIFDGNRPDVTTPKEMVKVMEIKYGKANRVWVMDRGMVSEKNLEFMRESGARYLVGTPKSLLKKFEQELLEQNWEEVQQGVEVRFCPSPEGTEETFVLCRSPGRKEKENAILNRFVAKLEGKLTKLAERAEQGKLKDRQKVERQIGRLLERMSRAASLFTVTVTEKGARLSIDIKRNEERYERALENGGSYILRTNWKETDPKTLSEYLHPVDRGRRRLPYRKTRSWYETHLPSEEREDPGTYPRLLSLPGDVADSAAMDEDIGAWHGAEKVVGRDEGNQVPRRHLACKGQNHQAQSCGHCLTTTQGLAPTDENPPP
jgi:transposase